MPRSKTGSLVSQLELMEPGDRTMYGVFETVTRTTDNWGGYTETWTRLQPAALWGQVLPEFADDMDRVFGNAIEGIAASFFLFPYHATVKVGDRLTINTTRLLRIRGVRNVGEMNLQTILACEEIVQ